MRRSLALLLACLLAAPLLARDLGDDLQKADALLSKGRARQARHAYLEILKEDPGHKWALDGYYRAGGERALLPDATKRLIGKDKDAEALAPSSAPTPQPTPHLGEGRSSKAASAAREQAEAGRDEAALKKARENARVEDERASKAKLAEVEGLMAKPLAGPLAWLGLLGDLRQGKAGKLQWGASMALGALGFVAGVWLLLAHGGVLFRVVHAGIHPRFPLLSALSLALVWFGRLVFVLWTLVALPAIGILLPPFLRVAGELLSVLLHRFNLLWELFWSALSPDNPFYWATALFLLIGLPLLANLLFVALCIVLVVWPWITVYFGELLDLALQVERNTAPAASAAAPARQPLDLLKGLFARKEPPGAAPAEAPAEAVPEPEAKA